MQDNQIEFIRSMHKAGMVVIWKSDDKKTHGPVLGFSIHRPHIVHIATGDLESTNRDAIQEVDIRRLRIGQFTILNQIEIPEELRDPVFMSL